LSRAKKLEDSLEVERLIQQVMLESDASSSVATASTTKTKKKKKKAKENTSETNHNKSQQIPTQQISVQSQNCSNSQTKNKITKGKNAEAPIVSEVQAGARPKTNKFTDNREQNSNIDKNLQNDSKQELTSTENSYLKDIISIISSKDNSELSYEELEALEVLAEVKLKNASKELKDLDDDVHAHIRSRAANLRQLSDQIFSLEDKKHKNDKDKAALLHKIRLIDCDNKQLDENLEQLNSLRRKHENENDDWAEEKGKKKREYLSKISTLEQNLAQIRNDKMKKSKKTDDTTPETQPHDDKTAQDETESNDDTGCPICLYSFKQIKQKGMRLVSTQCGHIYCHKCMDEVMDATNGDTECPICKKRITRNSYHTIYF